MNHFENFVFCLFIYIYISKSFFDEIKTDDLIKILMDFWFFVKIPVTRRNIFVHPGVFQPMVTIRVLLYWEGYFCIERIQKVWGVNTKVYVSSSLKTSNYSLFLYWISLTSYFWSKTALEIQELIMSYQFYCFIFQKCFRRDEIFCFCKSF